MLVNNRCIKLFCSHCLSTDRAVQAMVSKAEQMKAEQGAQMSLLLRMVIDK